MANVLVEEQSLKNIADAIRAKNGLTDKYKPGEMADAIIDLSTGGGSGDNTPAYKILARTSDSGTSLILPEGVTAIGNFAFYNNNRLSMITANYVTDIGQYAFGRGVLSNQTVALTRAAFNELLTIQNNAFYDHNVISEIVMPKAHTIGQKAFYQCSNLELDSLADTIETIGSSAFYKCTKLAIDRLPSAIKSIGANAFQYCNGITELTVNAIPITANATVIGSDAFSYLQNLEELDLTLGSRNEDYVASYGSNLFAHCTKLRKVVIRISGKHSRSTDMFDGCTALTDVTLPEGWQTILSQEFIGCSSLEEIELPSTITSISEYAFQNCTKLSSVIWDAACDTINNYAFHGCGFVNLELPSTITTIKNGAFAYNRSMKTCIIPGGITTLSSGTFSNCTVLEEVIFKGTPTSLGNASGSSSIFYNDISLRDIYVPWSSGDVANAPWGATNATIHYNSPVNGENITEVHISGPPRMLNREGTAAQFAVRFNKFCYEDQKGVTWSVTGSPNVSIDQNGLLTINTEDSTEYAVTVTVTSVANNSIYDSFTVTIGQAYISVDLNEGQWVDSGTEIDGNIVYKSDAGSYNIDNGASRARISFAGYQKIVVQIRSFAESSYDYTMAGNLDIAGYSITTNSNTVKQHTKSRSSSTTYYAAIYENIDGEDHFIEILYAKDGSGNSNDDRGYFYIDAAQCLRT